MKLRGSAAHLEGDLVGQGVCQPGLALGVAPRPFKCLFGVYAVCMGRTNVDIDDEVCMKVMRRYGLRTKREAINFALREVSFELTVDEARSLRGSGWEGDLAEMRTGRVEEQ